MDYASLITGLSLGLLIGAGAMWFIMDRRLRDEREARDRAVDVMSRAVARTPVTTLGVTEERRAAEEVRVEAERIQRELENAYADEVGEEPKGLDPRLGAGVDVGDEG